MSVGSMSVYCPVYMHLACYVDVENWSLVVTSSGILGSVYDQVLLA